jgi:hypothetical protein
MLAEAAVLVAVAVRLVPLVDLVAVVLVETNLQMEPMETPTQAVVAALVAVVVLRPKLLVLVARVLLSCLSQLLDTQA